MWGKAWQGGVFQITIYMNAAKRFVDSYDRAAGGKSR